MRTRLSITPPDCGAAPTQPRSWANHDGCLGCAIGPEPGLMLAFALGLISVIRRAVRTLSDGITVDVLCMDFSGSTNR